MRGLRTGFLLVAVVALVVLRPDRPGSGRDLEPGCVVSQAQAQSTTVAPKACEPLAISLEEGLLPGGDFQRAWQMCEEGPLDGCPDLVHWLACRGFAAGLDSSGHLLASEVSQSIDKGACGWMMEGATNEQIESLDDGFFVRCLNDVLTSFDPHIPPTRVAAALRLVKVSRRKSGCIELERLEGRGRLMLAWASTLAPMKQGLEPLKDAKEAAGLLDDALLGIRDAVSSGGDGGCDREVRLDLGKEIQAARDVIQAHLLLAYLSPKADRVRHVEHARQAARRAPVTGPKLKGLDPGYVPVLQQEFRRYRQALDPQARDLYGRICLTLASLHLIGVSDSEEDQSHSERLMLAMRLLDEAMGEEGLTDDKLYAQALSDWLYAADMLRSRSLRLGEKHGAIDRSYLRAQQDRMLRVIEEALGSDRDSYVALAPDAALLRRQVFRLLTDALIDTRDVEILLDRTLEIGLTVARLQPGWLGRAEILFHTAHVAMELEVHDEVARELIFTAAEEFHLRHTSNERFNPKDVWHMDLLDGEAHVDHPPERHGYPTQLGCELIDLLHLTDQHQEAHRLASVRGLVCGPQKPPPALIGRRWVSFTDSVGRLRLWLHLDGTGGNEAIVVHSMAALRHEAQRSLLIDTWRPCSSDELSKLLQQREFLSAKQTVSGQRGGHVACQAQASADQTLDGLCEVAPSLEVGPRVQAGPGDLALGLLCGPKVEKKKGVASSGAVQPPAPMPPQSTSTPPTQLAPPPPPAPTWRRVQTMSGKEGLGMEVKVERGRMSLLVSPDSFGFSSSAEAEFGPLLPLCNPREFYQILGMLDGPTQAEVQGLLEAARCGIPCDLGGNVLIFDPSKPPSGPNDCVAPSTFIPYCHLVCPN